VAEQDLPELAPEQTSTPPDWTAAVLDDFDEFLRDHASCEKKASGMALNVASHYPDRPALLRAMVDLAVEELGHYREVVRLLLDRGLQPGADRKDPYIHALNALIRKGSEHFMLDRLLVGAVVERRGAERFALVADAVDDEGLKKFYYAIAASEDRHWLLFVDLAKQYFPHGEVTTRLTDLSDAENQIMLELEPRAALH
jgi:tRNA-(ms[2]io[6]A)-hydroxylase